MRSKSGKAVSGLLVVLALLLIAIPSNAVHSLAVTSETEPSEKQAQETCQVTLITGDIVTIVVSPDGEKSIAIPPAKPNKLGHHFLIFEQNADTYVIPDSADLSRLDLELFNIDYLVDEEYYKESSLPVLVSYLPSLPKPQVQSLKGRISTLGLETELYEAVFTMSTCLAYDGIGTVCSNLLSQPEVEKIWLDKKVHVTLNDSVALIGAPTWWDAGYDGEGVEIAILDTGIDCSHPALDDLDDDPATNDPKVIVNINFTDDQSFDDLYGHGTHCAGIAAGTAAGSNYQGVAPGAWLWNVKVVNKDGWGYESWVINGLNFASLGPDGKLETGDEADIINMSISLGSGSDGTDPLSQSVNLAVERGLVVVVAAGNEGPELFTITSPGTAEKVLAVAASDKRDCLPPFSSRGPTLDFRVKPDILAPGVGITSSVPGGSYESWSGTSMSTPHVAGAAALLRQYYGDTVSPQFIKDALMYTAEDLGYDVYEQGSGRLDLAWEPWPIVGVTPATVSMGLLSPGLPPPPAPILTFFTEDTSPHNVTLSAELIDVINGSDHSDSVSLEPACFTIPPGEEAEVSLTVDLTSLPTSVYSGKVIATVDGGDSQSVHAIFGLAKLREIKVHKIDINGTPAQGDLVWLIYDGEPVESLSFLEVTDENGDASFYVPDGSYHLVSYGCDEVSEASIWTVQENPQDMVILDERDTEVIDFDPDKAGQIIAGKGSSLWYSHHYRWEDLWWYPSSFITRVSPISHFDASFKYEYYPKADFDSEDPELVDTDQWHNLRYSVTNVTADITFVADYANLVKRHTNYCVALDGQIAGWYQWSFDDIVWHDSCFYRILNAPQQRQEWFSAEPVYYSQQYLKDEPCGEWSFQGATSSPSGTEYKWGIGCHPLTSGVEFAVWGNKLAIWGPMSVDPWGNEFGNLYAEQEDLPAPGHIKITKDDQLLLDDDIYDWFWKEVTFENTPNFTVEVWGRTPLKLSSSSYTKLDFTADPTKDYRPPRIWFCPVEPGADLYGVVPGGNIKVAIKAEDESKISSMELHYSLDDGKTWNRAHLSTIEDQWYVFNLAQLQKTFVSLMVKAEDEHGNSIQRNTIRAFRIGGPTLGLVEGANVICYRGTTAGLPQALTNIKDKVEIIWARAAWTGGEWLFFDAKYPAGSNMTQLENGRAYIIVVAEDCIWELP